ncbi:VOC family protein [Rhodococcus fascians]|nr:VOC family protein [Rhodococcus fascians]MBY4237928.1 VOC family protein [Rhodococcus fascians]MBY4253321.1 VOC family protein [Rhodococcus fascians]MBY4268958.1 VOC family protein [Rhodococcus fascians]
MTAIVEQWELRARFAQALSDMYGKEVPSYTTLVEVTAEVNAEVMARLGLDAERFGTIDRVSAERHGAIRVGSEAEMRSVGRLFAGFGMYPVGFYDLRDASASSVPVVSTAFRPLDRVELARNPFRVFTSMLVTDDRRFFSEDIQHRLDEFLSNRTLFPLDVLDLADRAAEHDGLNSADADQFVAFATACFQLSDDPVDKAWYDALEAISSVAADIGGVTSTHINHLTPRVLDIDVLFDRMRSRGIDMIDRIQGPPKWKGPDVLLRQTSFRALAEPRQFVGADSTVFSDALRVRFGEVEARGIALTQSGRDLYDRMIADLDACAAADPSFDRAAAAVTVWAQNLPAHEKGLALADLAYFTFRVNPDRDVSATNPPADLKSLIEQDWVIAEPIVYEDFLPRSAAGIFQSNLTSDGSKNESQGTREHSIASIAAIIDRPVADPLDLYDAERAVSLRQVALDLGLSTVDVFGTEIRPEDL